MLVGTPWSINPKEISIFKKLWVFFLLVNLPWSERWTLQSEIKWHGDTAILWHTNLCSPFTKNPHKKTGQFRIHLFWKAKPSTVARKKKHKCFMPCPGRNLWTAKWEGRPNFQPVLCSIAQPQLLHMATPSTTKHQREQHSKHHWSGCKDNWFKRIQA